MSDESPHIEVRTPGRKPGAPVPQPLAMPGDDAAWRNLQSDQRKQGSGTGSLLVPDGAGWVEHDTLGIAEEVSRRWPNLRVAQCRQRCQDCAALGHFPFVVCELTKTGKTVPVLGFLRLDRQVVDTLWSLSLEKHDQQKIATEHNERVRAEIQRRSEEQQQAALEIIGAALKSPKYRWKGPGGIVIGEGMTEADARRAISQN